MRPSIRQFQPRGGIPRVRRKLAAGENLTVGYLGGSITQVQGWRVHNTRFLSESLPNCRVREVNASISGTGAGFGACRLEEHLLAEAPDLIFVEFRVNGGDHSMARTVEGIVRHTRDRLPETDLIFVYTLSESMLEELFRGEIPSPAGVELEQVAEAYAIPAIDFAPAILARIHNGTLRFRGDTHEPGILLFSCDGVHPQAAGHEVYAEVMREAVEALLSTPAPLPRPLPAPLHPGHWGRGHLVDPRPFLNEPEAWRDQSHALSPVLLDFHRVWPEIDCSRMLPTLLSTNTAGASISFRFEGTVFGFSDVGGPETGMVRVILEDNRPIEVSRFNSYCTRYRPQYYLHPELPEGVYNVRIEFSDAPPDKKAIVGAERFEKNPDYLRREFHLLRLLVNGRILPT